MVLEFHYIFLLVLILIGAYLWYRHLIKSSHFVYLTIALLIGSSISLMLGANDIANNLGIMMFYTLVLGAVLAYIDMRNGTNDYEPGSEHPSRPR